MDAQTKFQLAINEFEQGQRAGRLLIAEGARALAEAQRKMIESRRHTSMRAAMVASSENNWASAPVVRENNERIAAEWRCDAYEHGPNVILLDEPLQTRGAMVTSTGSAGGYLVEVGNQLAVQEAHSTIGSSFDLMTVNTARAATGNQFVGKLETLPTVSVLSSETTGITEQTPPTLAAALAPKNLASFGRHSRQWGLQSEAGAAAVSRLHTNAVKSKALQQILEGTGSNGQLLGLTANSGVPTAAGTSVDWAKVCTAMESVEKTGTGPFSWIVSAAAAKLLRQRARISGGDAILSGGKIGDYDCFVTGCTTNAVAAFGSWKDLQVFQWRPLELAVDPFSDFQSGIIGVRAWLTVDALPMLDGSFYTLTSIT